MDFDYQETLLSIEETLKLSRHAFSRVETDPADHEHGQGEIIDYVKVPDTLEPGWVFDKFE